MSAVEPGRKPRVAIAGATGFVGRALLRTLPGDFEVVALTRSRGRPGVGGTGVPVEWRACDLFSQREVEQALEGVDYAIYLVHSMLPSARLVQGRFEDLDLVLADNFARACRRRGVRQIVYVGGLVPDERPLSPHLASRLEVEETLAGHGVPLTSLRAGLIVGPGGSSLAILVQLVRRLPFMLLPRWTLARTQPIALRDVVRAVALCLGRREHFGATYDVGGPEVLRYRDLLRRTARLLGRRIPMLPVPLFSPRLSRLWVVLFSGAPAALVGPLIESLRHDMVCRPNALQSALAADALAYDAALRAALEPEGGRGAAAPQRAAPRPPSLAPADRAALRRARTVRSIQRMPLPPGRDARFAADEYVRFLPRFCRPFLRCEPSPDGSVGFHLAGTRRCLLHLRAAPERSDSDRVVYDVDRGLLLRRTHGVAARFELRVPPGGRWLLAAVHDFTPALPWAIYWMTQARIHLWVMRGFGRHLARLGPPPPGLAAAGGG